MNDKLIAYRLLSVSAIAVAMISGCAPEPVQTVHSGEELGIHPFAMPGGGFKAPASGADPSTLPPPVKIEQDGQSVRGTTTMTSIESPIMIF